MTTAPARTAIFAACAAAHAALIAAFWSTAPLRTAEPALTARVYALPAPGTVTATTDTVAATPLHHHSPDAPRTRAAPAAPGETGSPVAQANGGLALANAAIAHAAQVVDEPPPAVIAENEAADPAPATLAPAIAGVEASTTAPSPPPARALPPAPQRMDLQLAYHRMRAAQDALRFHHAQGEHLAWLQRRVTALLTAVAEPDAMREGARCTARVVDTRLSVQCDDPGLGERLERADGDLAVFLSRLISTAPGGAVEIAFLPAQPPVVAGL